MPVGATGNVYFSDGPAFRYLNDPAKTATAHDHRGWATLGDIGHVDDDGYLFLSDRKSFMIISGGVNIYPQEIENLLVTHPAVADAAVIGVPCEEMGEMVLALVQPAPDVVADAALAADLRSFARDALGSVKTPKRIDFDAKIGQWWTPDTQRAEPKIMNGRGLLLECQACSANEYAPTDLEPVFFKRRSGSLPA